MTTYPNELVRAAKNLLDNNDFNVLLRYRLKDLEEQVLTASEPNEVLEAHREYSQLRDFAEWITMLGKETR